MCFQLRGSPAISTSIANCVVVILTYYCSHSIRLRWFIVGDITLIFSHKSPSHCQCVSVIGCLSICQYLRSDVVGAVITEHCPIPPPGDSSGRTTSGGAGEGEHRRVSGWVSVQLEGDFTRDSNLACWRGK